MNFRKMANQGPPNPFASDYKFFRPSFQNLNPRLSFNPFSHSHSNDQRPSTFSPSNINMVRPTRSNFGYDQPFSYQNPQTCFPNANGYNSIHQNYSPSDSVSLDRVNTSASQNNNFNSLPPIPSPLYPNHLPQHPISFPNPTRTPFINMPPPNILPPPPVSTANIPCTSSFPPSNMTNQNSSSNQLFINPPFPSNILPNMSVPPPHILSNIPPTYTEDVDSKSQDSQQVNHIFTDEKEKAVFYFLSKFKQSEKHPKMKIIMTVSEFRSKLKMCFSVLSLLFSIKNNLKKNIKVPDEQWKMHVEQMYQFKNQLSEISKLLSDPSILNNVEKRLQRIVKKRKSKRRAKQNVLNDKLAKENERELINQNIDKWLDGIKEKNEKTKRETEMKKEADYILSEVRRKIVEAKKALEKFKAFQKLRTARQENAVKKGLFVSEEHTSAFECKMQILKSTMLTQLADYEAEEHALKVMLETEREGQLEEEAQWRLKKLKALQEKKKKNIIVSLFGDYEEPSRDNPLYLFYQHHIAGSNDVDHLVQIRHQWDVHLDDSGEAIPLQWVTPTAPSSEKWTTFSMS